ncbi:uncharacterized protein LOC135836279 [Planococcus citri]|uniref:uncharacterized protein LOC135836279 n=1 Tax=Planococcus citri TaxID=170843 RepID=UPI0031FA1D14
MISNRVVAAMGSSSCIRFLSNSQGVFYCKKTETDNGKQTNTEGENGNGEKIDERKEEFQALLKEVDSVKIRSELKGRIFCLIESLSEERKNHLLALERATKAESDRNILSAALLPYYAIVRTRGRVEYWETIFGSKYTHPTPVSSELEANPIASYEFHSMKWQWIWENCEDPRFAKIKDAAIVEFNNDTILAKQQLSTSFARLQMLLGTFGSVFVPERSLARKSALTRC